MSQSLPRQEQARGCGPRSLTLRSFPTTGCSVAPPPSCNSLPSCSCSGFWGESCSQQPLAAASGWSENLAALTLQQTSKCQVQAWHPPAGQRPNYKSSRCTDTRLWPLLLRLMPSPTLAPVARSEPAWRAPRTDSEHSLADGMRRVSRCDRALGLRSTFRMAPPRATFRTCT